MRLIITILITFLVCLFFIVFSDNTNVCAYRSPLKCYRCDYPGVILVGSPEHCTSVCSNRETNTIGSGTGINYVYNCVLKTCPSDKPLRGMFNECISCDDASQFVGVSNCEVCLNRYVDKQGYCVFKDNRVLKYEVSERMHPKQSCPPEKPLQSWNYQCFSCDVQREVAISSDYYWGRAEELSAICPQRVIIAGPGGSPSSYPSCPKDTPLLDQNGLCYSCYENLDIDLRYNENLCSRFCSGKRYVPEHSYNCKLCPKDRKKLNSRECKECGGEFIEGQCR